MSSIKIATIEDEDSYLLYILIKMRRFNKMYWVRPLNHEGKKVYKYDVEVNNRIRKLLE